MPKPKTEKPKSIKEILAAGARDIQQAQEEAKSGNPKPAKEKPAKKGKPKGGKPAASDATVIVEPPLNITESKRDINEIIAERVKVHDDIAVEVSKDTPIDEYLRIFDWITSLGEHVGFMIGDVCNAGEAIYGAKYELAIAATGRSIVTLRDYASVAKRVPREMRRASLSYSAHKAVARLKDANKEKVLKQAEAQRQKTGKAPTVKELSATVDKIEPPTPRAEKIKATKRSGSKKKGGKTPPPPHEMTPDEETIFEEALVGADEVATLVRAEKLKAFVFKIANNRKRDLSKALAPIVRFAAELEKLTGY